MDAEDFAQARTLTVLQHLRRDDIARPDAYLAEAARNVSRDWLRRERARAARRAALAAAGEAAPALAWLRAPHPLAARSRRGAPEQTADPARAARARLAALLQDPALPAPHREILLALLDADCDRAVLIQAEGAARPVGRDGRPRTPAQLRAAVDKRIQRALAAVRALDAARGLDP